MRKTFDQLRFDIGDWHIDTFGFDCGQKKIRRKLLEEAAEFMVASKEEAPEEAADVLMVLMAWAHRNGVDLLKEVELKFSIVKNRDQKARDDN